MKPPMNEVALQLQGAFYGVAIAAGLGLLALFFTVCTKLHRAVRENENNLEQQHRHKVEIRGQDLWDSMRQKGLLDQRSQAVDRLDLYMRLAGGAAVISGIVGFAVLGFKESYEFNLKTGTMAALLVELLPFISLASVLATLAVIYRAISLDRRFAQAADVALASDSDDAEPP